MSRDLRRPLREAWIVEAVRTPIGRRDGALRSVRPDDLAALVVHFYDTEVYRLPLKVYPSTYAFAAVTVLAATALSALVVRRRLDKLDLIAVLKTRE